MSDQTPLDAEAIRARLDAATGRDVGPLDADIDAEVDRVERATATLRALAPTDLRLLLDKVDSLIAHNGMLVTEIYHQAARAEAFREERDALVVQHQADLAARRTAEEHLRRDVVETDEERERLAAELDRVIREAAADKAKLAAVQDLITPKIPDWVPLTERHPEYFDPDPKETARKKGWRQGEEMLAMRIKSVLEKAPEMPRPPAEELTAKLDELQSELDALKARRDAPPETSREYLQRMGAEFRSNMARLKARDDAEAERDRLAAQEPVSGPETAGTGSGMGTGVAEAPGTAQASGEEA